MPTLQPVDIRIGPSQGQVTRDLSLHRCPGSDSDINPFLELKHESDQSSTAILLFPDISDLPDIPDIPDIEDTPHRPEPSLSTAHTRHSPPTLDNEEKPLLLDRVDTKTASLQSTIQLPSALKHKRKLTKQSTKEDARMLRLWMEEVAERREEQEALKMIDVSVSKKSHSLNSSSPLPTGV